MIKGTIKMPALQTLLNLLHAKSDGAVSSVHCNPKMAGMFNENDNPDLIAAKVRRANAEAKIAEWKAGELTGTNQSEDKTTLVDDIEEWTMAKTIRLSKMVNPHFYHLWRTDKPYIIARAAGDL